MMVIVLRNSLVVVLAMLQLFAPLVHAHSGDKSFNRGLHIPGLEAYYINHDAAVVQNVNFDTHAEGLLVVVDAGIKTPQDSFAKSDKVEFVLLPLSQFKLNTLSFDESNFSPHSQSFCFQRCYPTLSARAPPAR
jgi:hypothetical protein